MGGRGAKRLKVAQDGTAKETAPANTPPADVRERKFTDVRTNAKPNALFTTFYRANLVDTGLMNEADWEKFLEMMAKPLPTTFWITHTHADAAKVKEVLHEFRRKAEGTDGITVQPISWVPDDMAWFVEAPRVMLRKDPTFSELHRFLIRNTEKGVINRQEEASMVPAHVLGVEPGSKCLDMCAAPGSKTAQLLSMLSHQNHLKWGRGCGVQRPEEHHQLHGRVDYSEDNGVVVANDMSTDRVNILVHQVKRLARLYPLAVFVSHNAIYFPSLKRPTEGAAGTRSELRFDRILCDVMCSGDGTLRKAPHMWRQWKPNESLQLHKMQVQVALRAARLTEVGGRVVYSTCSLSPIENEAAVAHILRKARGSLRLLDARKLVSIKSSPGLTTWQAMCPKKNVMYATFEAAKAAGASQLRRFHFPPADEAVRDELPKCLRLFPHQGDFGGFFVAVFEKTAETPKRDAVAASQDIEDDVEAYDSDLDEDEEEGERVKTLARLHNAIKTQTNEIELAKAKAKLQRMTKGGALQRELAKYTPLCDSVPNAMAMLHEAYGLSKDFPVQQLLCRYHLEVDADGKLYQPHQGVSNQVLYLSAGATDMMQTGTHPSLKRQLRIVSGGLRFLVRDRMNIGDDAQPKEGAVAAPAATEEKETSSKIDYRFAQEAVELVMPYVSKRTLTLDSFDDTRTLLKSKGVKKLSIRDITSAGAQKEAESTGSGGIILLLKTQSGKYLPVSGLRTRHALNVYVDDQELTEIRTICGIEEPLVDAAAGDAEEEKKEEAQTESA